MYVKIVHDLGNGSPTERLVLEGSDVRWTIATTPEELGKWEREKGTVWVPFEEPRSFPVICIEVGPEHHSVACSGETCSIYLMGADGHTIDMIYRK